MASVFSASGLDDAPSSAAFTGSIYSNFLPFFSPPPSVGGLDLKSRSRGCARLGSGVAPPLGVVEKEVAVLIVLVRRHRRAVGAAVRRAVNDEVRAQSRRRRAQPRCAACPQVISIFALVVSKGCNLGSKS